ncbi:MAG: hypothetical protein KOO60_08615 [Gemmatimonadales bacterium]|nr:hypothetical protein [Gemmatimonadales bacterium]
MRVHWRTLNGKWLCLAFTLALLGVVSAPASDLAFTFIAEGDLLPDMELDSARGGSAGYLGGEDSQARVFAFVKDGRVSSNEFLETMAGLHEEFLGRPVSWSLVVSKRCSPAWIDTVCNRCPDVSVLIDKDDKLYGTLGVPLTPVVGIGDGDRILRAYLTYRKINYQALISAHVKFILGDIDQAELDLLLNPHGRMRDTVAGSSARKLKLARLLFDKQKFDLAIKQVESALSEQPNLPEAYELLVEIRLAGGDEAGAAEAREKADALADSTAGSAESNGDGN